MKEELRELKELVVVLASRNEELANVKDEFNASVDLSRVGMSAMELLDEDVTCSYDLATRFYDEYEYVWELANELRAAHPRYQERHFINALADMIVENKNWDEANYEKAVDVARNYMLYEGNGFYDIHNLEIEVYSLGEKIVSNKDEVVNQAVERVTDFGKNVADGTLNILRPYGEVAKGQYVEASSKVKAKAQEVANKGVKSLRKVLDKVEGKINNNNNNN